MEADAIFAASGHGHARVATITLDITCEVKSGLYSKSGLDSKGGLDGKSGVEGKGGPEATRGRANAV